ncbi:unnamed protein product [Caenorhabditis sp. 36 PRJEB53466]|nr:unnamed protein product [Caenorhabditis sp. 36 PRJEB53466]
MSSPSSNHFEFDQKRVFTQEEERKYWKIVDEVAETDDKILDALFEYLKANKMTAESKLRNDFNWWWRSRMIFTLQNAPLEIPKKLKLYQQLKLLVNDGFRAVLERYAYLEMKNRRILEYSMKPTPADDEIWKAMTKYPPDDIRMIFKFTGKEVPHKVQAFLRKLAETMHLQEHISELDKLRIHMNYMLPVNEKFLETLRAERFVDIYEVDSSVFILRWRWIEKRAAWLEWNTPELIQEDGFAPFCNEEERAIWLAFLYNVHNDDRGVIAKYQLSSLRSVDDIFQHFQKNMKNRLYLTSFPLDIKLRLHAKCSIPIVNEFSKIVKQNRVDLLLCPWKNTIIEYTTAKRWQRVKPRFATSEMLKKYSPETVNRDMWQILLENNTGCLDPYVVFKACREAGRATCNEYFYFIHFRNTASQLHLTDLDIASKLKLYKRYAIPVPEHYLETLETYARLLMKDVNYNEVKERIIQNYLLCSEAPREPLKPSSSFDFERTEIEGEFGDWKARDHFAIEINDEIVDSVQEVIIYRKTANSVIEKLEATHTSKLMEPPNSPGDSEGSTGVRIPRTENFTPEEDKAMWRFLIDNSPNCGPFEVWNSYRAETGSRRSPSTLYQRFRKYLSPKLHQMDFDIVTKVKLSMKYKIVIAQEFLSELRRFANVEIGGDGYIISYQPKCGKTYEILEQNLTAALQQIICQSAGESSSGPLTLESVHPTVSDEDFEDMERLEKVVTTEESAEGEELGKTIASSSDSPAARMPRLEHQGTSSRQQLYTISPAHPHSLMQSGPLVPLLPPPISAKRSYQSRKTRPAKLLKLENAWEDQSAPALTPQSSQPPDTLGEEQQAPPIESIAPPVMSFEQLSSFLSVVQTVLNVVIETRNNELVAKIAEVVNKKPEPRPEDVTTKMKALLNGIKAMIGEFNMPDLENRVEAAIQKQDTIGYTLTEVQYALDVTLKLLGC